MNLKNHRENDKEKTSGIIPESPGSEYCPVQSFAKYISKLHPSCDRLWQKPRDDFDDSDKTWYYNAPIGEKTLGNFMTSLSKLCRLSQIYTNHSIRATGATILAKNNYCDAQIMAVTGHKSVAALSMYQRVENEDKIKMSKSLSDSILKVPSKTLALPAATSTLALSAATSTLALPAATNTLALPSATSTQTSMHQFQLELFKTRNEYRPKPMSSFVPKHLSVNMKDSEAAEATL